MRPPPVPATATSITIAKPKPGRLQVRNPDVGGLVVTEAESGTRMGEIGGVITALDLPPGFYNAAFGPVLWKSVAVKPGETTVLDPGVIEITAVAPAGHKVLDWETGVEVGEIRGVKRALTVLPSTFTVTFGNAEWRNIEVKAGERRELNPAVIHVSPPEPRGNKVTAEDGTVVGTLRCGQHAPRAARQIHAGGRREDRAARPCRGPANGDQAALTLARRYRVA